MTIAIKKFGDAHVYTVVSYDDYENDPYYCCVKYEPGDSISHPGRANLAENDWVRIDRHEVEHYTRDWFDLVFISVETRKLYQIDITEEEVRECLPSVTAGAIASLVRGLPEKAMLSLDQLNLIKSEMKTMFKTQTNYFDERHIGIIAVSYTQLDLTDIRDIWNRTMFIQPSTLLKHISIINKLIQDYTG